jgi:hypothetical protein
MLALCARYQLRPVGLAPNSSQSRTACDDGSPAKPPRSATVSHPSRSSRSLTDRHHVLPGGDASSGSSTPRRACQRMKDNAARLNGRCRGARPVGPWKTRAINARRAAGSSRTAATCASARTSAPSCWLIQVVITVRRLLRPLVCEQDRRVGPSLRRTPTCQGAQIGASALDHPDRGQARRCVRTRKTKWVGHGRGSPSSSLALDHLNRAGIGPAVQRGTE